VHGFERYRLAGNWQLVHIPLDQGELDPALYQGAEISSERLAGCPTEQRINPEVGACEDQTEWRASPIAG
jgi:hypothetical protein